MAKKDTDIAKLKQKLAAGGLSQEQYNSIVKQIRNAGGKVNTANYPAAGSTETPTDSRARTQGSDGNSTPLPPATSKSDSGPGSTSTRSEGAPPQGDSQPLAPAEPGGKKDPGTTNKRVNDDPAADPTTVEGSIKSAKDIAAAATAYGDEQANKYITADTFGRIDASTSAAMQDYLNTLKGRMGTAGQLTGLENEALANIRAGLGGYTSPQVQAMRESAIQEIQRSFAPQLNAIQAQTTRNVGMGRAGGAAFAQTQDLKTQERGLEADLERDLLVKNADETQKRAETFANLVRSTEDARFGRQSSADSLYGSALSSEEANKTAKETFNINQKTNEDTARASLSQAAAGTFAGLQQGAQSTAAAQSWNDYLKTWNQQQIEVQERLAKLGYKKQEKMLDKQLAAIQNLY